MNNYDFNYNENIIDEESSKEKLILHLISLKWLNYFLIGFTIYQIFFFVGFYIYSIIIWFFILYICYSFIRIVRKDSLSVEFEFAEINKDLAALNFKLNIAIILTIVDVGYSFISKNAYIKELLVSDDFFQRNYGIFICYILLVKVLALLYLRYSNFKISEAQLAVQIPEPSVN